MRIVSIFDRGSTAFQSLSCRPVPDLKHARALAGPFKRFDQEEDFGGHREV